MSKAVLIAVATEMDGHAMADAIRTTVPNYDSEVSVKNLIIKKLSDNNGKAHITGITRDNDIWYVVGWYADEVYTFSAIIAPSNYRYIQTGTG